MGWARPKLEVDLVEADVETSAPGPRRQHLLRAEEEDRTAEKRPEMSLAAYCQACLAVELGGAPAAPRRDRNHQDRRVAPQRQQDERGLSDGATHRTERL